MSAVRYANNGLEHRWARDVSRGFKVFAFGVKGERLARLVGSDGLDCDGGVGGHGARPPMPVMEKQPEAGRHIGFRDSDFNKAVTEVHEETIVWSAFAFAIVLSMSAQRMRMDMASATVPS